MVSKVDLKYSQILMAKCQVRTGFFSFSDITNWTGGAIRLNLSMLQAPVKIVLVVRHTGKYALREDLWEPDPFCSGLMTCGEVQWNLDLTKSLGTGQICSLNGGFVISKTSI